MFSSWYEHDNLFHGLQGVSYFCSGFNVKPKELIALIDIVAWSSYLLSLHALQ